MVEERAESSLNYRRSDDRHERTEPKHKFRNYIPQTKFIDGLSVTSPSEPLSINHLIQDKLDLIPSDGNYRIDHTLLEPKKVDWDLKRRFEKRLKKLESDTSKAVRGQVRKEKKELKRT